jgi:hypothetical protein
VLQSLNDAKEGYLTDNSRLPLGRNSYWPQNFENFSEFGTILQKTSSKRVYLAPPKAPGLRTGGFLFLGEKRRCGFRPRDSPMESLEPAVFEELRGAPLGGGSAVKAENGRETMKIGNWKFPSPDVNWSCPPGE